MLKPWFTILAVTSSAFAVILSAAPAQARMTSTDRQFVMKAAQSGMGEVQLAQLAVQRGIDSNVRDFAERMVKDHSAANRTLARIATREGITLPSGTDAGHRAMLQRLSRLTGPDFDRAYAQTQIRDHRAAVALFQSEVTFGGDPRLRQFAASTLPTIKMHRGMTYEVAASLVPTKSRMAHRRMHPMH